MIKKIRIGYTIEVFELLHIGYLNIVKNSKSLYDYLVVGVTTNERTIKIKENLSIIHFDERFKIIKSLKYVDKIVAKKSTKDLL